MLSGHTLTSCSRSECWSSLRLRLSTMDPARCRARNVSGEICRVDWGSTVCQLPASGARRAMGYCSWFGHLHCSQFRVICILMAALSRGCACGISVWRWCRKRQPLSVTCPIRGAFAALPRSPWREFEVQRLRVESITAGPCFSNNVMYYHSNR